MHTLPKILHPLSLTGAAVAGPSVAPGAADLRTLDNGTTKVGTEQQITARLDMRWKKHHAERGELTE